MKANANQQDARPSGAKTTPRSVNVQYLVAKIRAVGRIARMAREGGAK